MSAFTHVSKLWIRSVNIVNFSISQGQKLYYGFMHLIEFEEYCKETGQVLP